MRHHPFRRGAINEDASLLEAAALTVDPYLYIDVAFEKPGQIQLWRKHPQSHLPMLICDIPSNVCAETLIDMLHLMDHSDVDLYANAHNSYEEKLKKNRQQARYRAETNARELAYFIRNNF